MCELERWIERNKKLCVLTGIFGLLVSPFLWPFFLALIFQSLSLAVPIIISPHEENMEVEADRPDEQQMG
ncbi:MAG: hypothetical protein Q4E89_06785 [Eubacteriales bacterium]|nr:hypothetical protein [Eubacteriales bacterium]